MLGISYGGRALIKNDAAAIAALSTHTERAKILRR